MHHTQDLILTIGALVFVAALIPTIAGKQKPALVTSLVSGTVLLVFAGVYSSLLLWFSAVTTSISGLMWLVLAFQKYRQAK